jgi:hypothetical protein
MTHSHDSDDDDHHHSNLKRTLTPTNLFFLFHLGHWQPPLDNCDTNTNGPTAALAEALRAKEATVEGDEGQTRHIQKSHRIQPSQVSFLSLYSSSFLIYISDIII